MTGMLASDMQHLLQHQRFAPETAEELHMQQCTGWVSLVKYDGCDNISEDLLRESAQAHIAYSTNA